MYLLPSRLIRLHFRTAWVPPRLAGGPPTETEERHFTRDRE